MTNITDLIDLIRGNNGINLAASPTITTLRAPGSTTILVNTITGLPDSFIAEMGTPDLVTGLITNGVVFRGHPGTGQIIIDDIGVGYADAGSAANDVIVLKPTAEWANNIADILANAFGVWKDWTPTISYGGGTTNPTSNTKNYAKYIQIGKTVHFSLSYSVVKGSGNRTLTGYSLPVPIATDAYIAHASTVTVRSSSPSFYGSAYTDGSIVKIQHGVMDQDGLITASGTYEAEDI